MEFKGILKDYLIEMQDKSVVFKGEKMIIELPEEFIERGVTTINQTTICTLGIFECYIFDDIDEKDISKAVHKFTLKLPSNIFMKPSHIDITSRLVENIEDESFTKENFYNLVFLKDDTFIISTSIVQSFGIVDNFIYMLLNGQIPKTIRYDEIAKLWADCAFINGSGSLKSDFNTLAMIVANIVRDPKNFSDPFRYNYDKYYERGIYNGKMLRYMDIPRYISNFTAITGSDPRHSITVALERIHGEHEQDVKTPVEEMIK